MARAVLRKKFDISVLILGVAALVLVYGIFEATSAHAVPSFARQTGQGCPICHTNFPELTPFGRAFKLNGYTLSTGESDLPPLAVMVQTAFTNTQAGQSGGAASGYGPNDNFSLEAVSLFYGGKIIDNLGALAQVTYSDTSHNFNWDNTDVRYTDSTTLFDHDVIFGLDFNNNPTLSDIYNTTPAWGFPYAAPSLAPHPAAAPLIQSLAQQVAALGAYSMTDDTLYAEFNLYKTLSTDTQRTLGIHPDGETEISGVAPYWRVALQHQWDEHFLEAGTFGLFSDTYPGRVQGFGSDKFVDYGVDAQYQYISEHHVAGFYTTFIHEDQTLGASQATGVSANSSNTLNSFNVRGTYIYSQDWSKYGVTVQYFSINGSTDTGLYAPAPISGSNNASPNSRGWIFELDYMPFINTQPLSFWPWAQVKFSLQYTLYNKFNGAGTNYDGSGRNASDNNTLFLLAWIAF
jgi:hypothetical protein